MRTRYLKLSKIILAMPVAESIILRDTRRRGSRGCGGPMRAAPATSFWPEGQEKYGGSELAGEGQDRAVSLAFSSGK